MTAAAPADVSSDFAAALSKAEGGACLRVAPGRWVVAQGPFVQAKTPPREGVAFYRNDFGLTRAEPWLIPAQAWEMEALPAVAEGALDIAWSAPPREGFEAALETVLAGLRSGLWQKAVLAAPEKGRITAGDSAELAARALCHREAAVCWPYVWREGAEGCAGVTPETLFTLRGNILQTMALAGTARTAEQEDFEHDAKQIREHEIVADSLRARLTPWGEVTRGPREVLNIGGLIHFITRFEVRLSAPAAAHDLVCALHPTPAMGIVPRTAENLEALRGWREQLGVPATFGAPLGVQWSGGTQMLVAIRGLWWQGGGVTLPAGCGIVDGSALEREWRELGLKRRWVKQSFGLDA